MGRTSLNDLEYILLNDFTCRGTRLHNADWFNRMITLGSIQRYAVQLWTIENSQPDSDHKVDEAELQKSIQKSKEMVAVIEEYKRKRAVSDS